MRLLLITLLSAAGMAAAESPRQANWSELGFVVGRDVQIAMRDGAQIGGKVLAVEPAALRMQIEKTSNPAVYRKGEFRVPRNTLKAFEMSAKTKHYRIISTVVGSAAGLVLGVVAALKVQGGVFGKDNPGGSAAALAGIWGGGTAVGYLLGNAGDQKTVTVVVRD